jgi:hypothetical protein
MSNIFIKGEKRKFMLCCSNDNSESIKIDQGSFGAIVEEEGSSDLGLMGNQLKII